MWGDLLDFVYPRACAGCGQPGPSESPHLCWDCLAECTFVQPPFCAVCGNPVSGYIDNEYICSLCSAARPHFNMARSCVRYDGVFRKMLLSLKYQQGIWYVEDLSRILEVSVNTHYDVDKIDTVAFVPLYAAKKRERGFNQSELLAKNLAKKLHKPVLSRCLVRKHWTESQTNLTADERLINVKGAFQARWVRWIEGKRVLLVDDVMTTGATVSECARALKEGGAVRVDVLTVARR